ncbi:MAG: CAAX protease [Leptolyngbyaceae cyanobacterium bins.349]|nr:CAAX protease [Leptolyngbyaceae cyanobacterium bins.349]
MNETAFSRGGELVGGAFGLSQNAFRLIDLLPGGIWLALLVVLLAGLSLSIGQSIVLFINRVKPTRFVFSLLINAILFTFGYIFLVLSTWLLTLLPGSVNVPLSTLFKVLGLAYAPLLFSFLGALPHVGYPLQNLFSIWNLLAMVVAFTAVAGTGLTVSLGYVAFGWVVKQLLENTVGQPIAQFGQMLADKVAGVDLIDSRSELRELVASRTRPADPIGFIAHPSQPPTVSPNVREFVYASGRGDANAAQAVSQAVVSSVHSGAVNVVQGGNSADPLRHLEQKTRGIPKPLLLGLSLLGMVIVFVLIAILLRPIRDTLFGWHDSLPRVFRWLFDLFWIAVVAIVFAGILAPLETLGWWAGWFGDDLDTSSAQAIAPADAAAPSTTAAGQPISRYVVYLDGIGQSGEEYTPDVEDFLAALQPALPSDVQLVSGLMMYSVLNQPLDQDRPLAFVWRTADKMRWTNPAAVLGLMLNLRNVFIVAVSADKRYGPIYNQGIAQVLFDGLVKRGYHPGSGTPITLIGYSGGGEMSVAAAPYLKKAMGAPIDVISLGGVMSANNDFLKLEQLYHVIGEQDFVERVGPIIFPGRWKLFPLSYWNRAKRRGNISIISAGPVGHQVPGGYMDPKATLPDGRTHLQHTIEIILKILEGSAFQYEEMMPRQLSNYALYQQAAFVHPGYYPLDQTVDRRLYHPIGQWMGRLILPQPEQRHQVQGCLLEIHHAPANHAHLVGKIVNLRWMQDPLVQKLVQATTKDVHFSADAEYGVKYGGLVHPTRLNHWKQVNPLESLAGARPEDDMMVMLNEPVQVEAEPTHSLYIRSTPVQITGRYYGVVRFVQSIAGTEQFQVVHFNPNSRQFDGATEVVLLPQVILAEAYGSYPSTSRDLEKVPLNEQGWYIYGAKNAAGQFVVQSLAPRALLRVQPDRVITGREAARRYILKEAWANAIAQKGTTSSVLCVGDGETRNNQALVDDWQEGDRALVVHTYGGIGGNQKEPAAGTPIFFGHFAYGVAQVVRDPLTEELRFDLRYHQVYTHNTDGLVAGTLHWSRYLGDRQFGWAGSRPTCDLLIKLNVFTGYYDFAGQLQSPLDAMLVSLQVMTARYRIGDGTGGTFVGPANNCSQDSNQALFSCLSQTETAVSKNQDWLRTWAQHHPEKAQQFQALIELQKELKQELQPLGGSRPDWEKNELNLGSTLEDHPIRNLITGLGSWRTMFPRLASDKIARIFLKRGAAIWVLRTNQIGGYDPNIEPIAPTSMSFL